MLVKAHFDQIYKLPFQTPIIHIFRLSSYSRLLIPKMKVVMVLAALGPIVTLAAPAKSSKVSPRYNQPPPD